ncbi:hypothetical protein [Bacillus solimangrovi]|uniref:hypothetical protein n=1 Tax=Bacillus solimangrovi TaxID=1305675 RepID=UPI001586A22B|nr:hypothetical protein [Bacillus solimangrovi]
MSNTEDNKTSLEEKEVLDGCIGCASLGCLPLPVILLAFIIKLISLLKVVV